jgi:tripartite-type tricarboxylate transporter receptor subunit TctC
MKRKKKSKQAFFFWFVLLPMVFPASAAFGADEPYPNRPIQIVINMAPGGATDLMVKIVGERLGEVLGQPLIRVHKPGGGGSLAASFVAKAKPDGYTLLTGTSTTNILIPLIKKVDYTMDDLYPLGIYAKAVHYFLVKADARWKTLEEFIEEARARPGQLKISSYGKQTFADFVIEDLAKKAGVKFIHLPTKGCAEAVSALLGGHVEADVCTSSMGQAAAGTVRLLGVADDERSDLFPEAKTFKECGYPVNFSGFFSFTLPAKTPKPILDKLSNAMQEVFKRYGNQMGEELKKVDYLPFFCDPTRTMQEFRKNYENAHRMAKELGYIQ